MGKIIIDSELLGPSIMDVITRTVNSLIFELELDGEVVSKEYETAIKNKELFLSFIDKYFKDHLKVIL